MDGSTKRHVKGMVVNMSSMRGSGCGFLRKG